MTTETAINILENGISFSQKQGSLRLVATIDNPEEFEEAIQVVVSDLRCLQSMSKELREYCGGYVGSKADDDLELGIQHACDEIMRIMNEWEGEV